MSSGTTSFFLNILFLLCKLLISLPGLFLLPTSIFSCPSPLWFLSPVRLGVTHAVILSQLSQVVLSCSVVYDTLASQPSMFGFVAYKNQSGSFIVTTSSWNEIFSLRNSLSSSSSDNKKQWNTSRRCSCYAKWENWVVVKAHRFDKFNKFNTAKYIYVGTRRFWATMVTSRYQITSENMV